MKHKISGAVFDLDGTLLDSNFVWRTLGDRMMLKHGREPDPVLTERLKMTTLREAAEIIVREYGFEGTVEEYMDEINHMVDDEYFYRVQPKAGSAQLLKALQSAGVRMCLCTATDRYQVEAALERVGLLPYFEEIFTCTELKLGKGTPEIYEITHEFLGTPKEETFVFDDAVHAITSAKKAGLRTCAVYDEFDRDDREVIEATADIFLEEVCEAIDRFQLS